MSKKYVIEMKSEYEDTIRGIMVLGARDSNLYMDALAVEDMEELNSDYINEHFGDLQDTVYQKGLEEGKKATWELVADASSAEYQRGLDDAWEAAKKLFSSMADSDIDKAFPIEWNNGGFKALMNLQPQEAIEKLKAYEEKQDDEIEVGDTVNLKDASLDKENGLVTKIWNNDYCYIVWSDGSGGSWAKNMLVKTGKHIDIASILEEMRHD